MHHETCCRRSSKLFFRSMTTRSGRTLETMPTVPCIFAPLRPVTGMPRMRSHAPVSRCRYSAEAAATRPAPNLLRVPHKARSASTTSRVGWSVHPNETPGSGARLARENHRLGSLRKLVVVLVVPVFAGVDVSCGEAAIVLFVSQVEPRAVIPSLQTLVPDRVLPNIV